VHSPRKVSDLTRCTSHNGHNLATRKEYDARCQAVMRFCAAARCTAARFTAQHRTAQHCTALHSAQHSTVQHTARHSTARHCAARRVTPRLQTGRLRPPSKQRPLLLVLPSCCPSRGRCPFVYIRRIKLSLRGIRCPFAGFDVPSRDSMSLRGIQVSIRRMKLSLRGI
jgi:hypothetical protein